MRLWHKDLISVLPRQQLLSQWRECCCIARNISVNGTPNHILVNKILDYPIEHFITYSRIIYREMLKRGYKANWSKFQQYSENRITLTTYESIFKNWHNDQYFIQCFYNLQEKHDCGGISENEWALILKHCIALHKYKI